MNVHLNHVHKETLGPIENALPNRSSHEIEIFGMEGIPEEIVNAHRQRVITTYAQAEASRRAASGSSSGGVGPNPAKKPKTESVSEMKKRLAEHRAKKAAEEAAAAAPPSEMVPPTDGMNGNQSGYNQVSGMVSVSATLTLGRSHATTAAARCLSEPIRSVQRFVWCSNVWC